MPDPNCLWPLVTWNLQSSAFGLHPTATSPLKRVLSFWTESMPFETMRTAINKQIDELSRYINLKLAALGQPTSTGTADPYFLELAGPLLRNYYQKDQLLGERMCSTDTRIQSFLDDYLKEVAPGGAARLPVNTFVLDRPGLARAMSLPPSADTFSSPYLNSYRIPQGILHNPKSDRRATQGLFHIVEGGLPVPADKAELPKVTFAALLAAALKPTDGLLNSQKECNTFSCDDTKL